MIGASYRFDGFQSMTMVGHQFPLFKWPEMGGFLPHIWRTKPGWTSPSFSMRQGWRWLLPGILNTVSKEISWNFLFIHVLHVVAPTHALYKSLNISFSKPTWQHQVSEFARGTLSRTLPRMKTLGCLMCFKFYVHIKPIITSVLQPPGKGLLTTHWPLSSSQHILRYHVFAWHPFKKGDRMAMSLICLIILWWFIYININSI